MLDSFTSLVLLLLLIITAVMLVQHGTAAQEEEGAAVSRKALAEEMYKKRLDQDKKIYKEVKRLFGMRQYSAAQEALHKVEKEHPDNPRSFIYQARLYYNTGKIAEAISSYRQAVEQEPDFVDDKTPLFIGKSILEHLRGAKEQLMQEKEVRPEDTAIQQALDELLALQRRAAGGCE